MKGEIVYCSLVKCDITNKCNYIGKDDDGKLLYICLKCKTIYKICNSCGEKRMIHFVENEKMLYPPRRTE
jgi:rRNA maturation endonuclease Nob1